MDMRDGWNFGNPAHVEKALKQSQGEEPYLLVLGAKGYSPYAHSSAASIQKEAQEIQETVRLAKRQIASGGLVILEHPWKSNSWSDPEIKELLTLEGVTVTRLGDSKVSSTPKGIITNSECIAKQCSRDNTWKNWEIPSGSTDLYQPRYVAAVLRGLAQEMHSVGRLASFEAGGPTVEEEDPTDQWAPIYYDEITGAVLNPESSSRQRCINISRTSAWVPVRNTRPDRLVYLSSRLKSASIIVSSTVVAGGRIANPSIWGRGATPPPHCCAMSRYRKPRSRSLRPA